MNEIDDFKKDRAEALRSMDEQQIRKYMKKYGETCPSDMNIFWEGVHKARIVLGIGVGESQKWLKENERWKKKKSRR